MTSFSNSFPPKSKALRCQNGAHFKVRMEMYDTVLPKDDFIGIVITIMTFKKIVFKKIVYTTGGVEVGAHSCTPYVKCSRDLGYCRPLGHRQREGTCKVP